LLTVANLYCHVAPEDACRGHFRRK